MVALAVARKAGCRSIQSLPVNAILSPISKAPIPPPAGRPTGVALAIVLSRNGHSQIYSVNADGSGLRKCQSAGVDTEPRYSSDGNIYFQFGSRRRQRIYRVSANGGDAQRVTFEGSYNVSPRPSPDGKTLAFITRREGRFSFAAMDLASRQVQVLSDSNKDESPSFAPNSRMILIATEIGEGAAFYRQCPAPMAGSKQRLSVAAGDIARTAWGAQAQ